MPGMKRLTPFLLGLFLLTACGGNGATATICNREYWDGTVGVCLPTGWSVLDEATLQQRGVPEETVAAFSADAAVSGLFPTVVVIEEPLTQAMNPVDYSAASIRSVTTLPSYASLDTTQTDIDGDSVQLHVFTAQPVADEPARRFYQVSTVKGNTGYTINASAPVAVDEAIEQQIIAILQSATFEEPLVEAAE